jgi:serine/threonine protein kinase
MLGPYALLRELGRGGFGIVYAARDTRTCEEVAIKVLHDQAGAEARCRFATEVISTGLLRHPNIVRLLDSGADGERDWYAMELIHGSTLLERLRTGLPKPATAARWLADLAGAVAHAHSNKIVHRDLKPANVLIGTACYMAPEQARGDSAE